MVFCLSRFGRCLSYLDWVKTIDPLQLKFLDECHFIPKLLAKGQGKVWSVREARLCSERRVAPTKVREFCIRPSSSVTLITSIDPEQKPVFFDYRIEVNDQVESVIEEVARFVIMLKLVVVFF